LIATKILASFMLLLGIGSTATAIGAYVLFIVMSPVLLSW